MTEHLAHLKSELACMANPEKASIFARFFKTGKGEYAEGDIFLGISVPEQRKIARKYVLITLKELRRLIRSPVHEERLVALLILIERYKKGTPREQEAIAAFYLGNTRHINNWDLVDLSSGHVLGHYLMSRNREVLYQLARSENLWERRIAIMATFAFIRNHDFTDTLRIAEIFLQDRHDLIHKAVGWMLREVGKRDIKTEESFLEKHAHEMPRTMLRYAVERFDKKRRTYFLGKKGNKNG